MLENLRGLPGCMRGKSRNSKAPAFAAASFYTKGLWLVEHIYSVTNSEQPPATRSNSKYPVISTGVVPSRSEDTGEWRDPLFPIPKQVSPLCKGKGLCFAQDDNLGL